MRNTTESWEGKVLCVIEEMDLGRDKKANNRVKDWVLGRKLPIHHKHQTPYDIPNTTHWVHCANDARFCPVFPGDTRITMIFVPKLSVLDKVNRTKMHRMLKQEAPAFLQFLLDYDLPSPGDRLRVEYIDTEDKLAVSAGNRTPLQMFMAGKHARGTWLLHPFLGVLREVHRLDGPFGCHSVDPTEAQSRASCGVPFRQPSRICQQAHRKHLVGSAD